MEPDEINALFLDELERICKPLGLAGTGNLAYTISVPKPEFGDLCTSVAFSLAKELKRNPREIAEKIAEGLRGAGIFSKVDVVGGYINCTLPDSFLLSAADAISLKGKDYCKQKRRGLRAVVEYPSVNPNKPWHLGHLRNALLGNAVSNLFALGGYDVIRLDYIDDLGLQVAQSLWGYVNLQLPQAGKFDLQLGLQYVEVSGRFESGEIEPEVRGLLKRMEEQDNEVSEQARELAVKCLKAQYETAFSLGIYHDLIVFESDLARFLVKEGLEAVKGSGFVKRETQGKNAGCLVIEINGLQKVLLRSDGTMTYLAKDIIFHLWKFGLLKSRLPFAKFLEQPNGLELLGSSRNGKPMGFSADVMVNIIGVEQSAHQESIKKFILLKEPGKEYIHLAYAHARYANEDGDKSGKFSGREGTWQGYIAAELIAKTQEKIAQIVEGRQLGENAVHKLADCAIKYAFLKISPEKELIFSWDDALNFNANSGLYIMYSYARICRLLEKARELGVGAAGEGASGKAKSPAKKGPASRAAKPVPAAWSAALAPEERLVLRKLLEFGGVVTRSQAELKPSYIPAYLFELASIYTQFYEKLPIVKETDDAKRLKRLQICKAVAIVLENGLALLGIDAVERM